MNNKLFGINKYQEIAGDRASSDMILGYKVPGKDVAVYTKQGLEYIDCDGHQQLIHKKKIPEFLAAVRGTDNPWLQYDFAQLFRHQADPYHFQFQDHLMEGAEQFAHDLSILAKLDYSLLLLGARVAQLQMVHKGSYRTKAWCEESKHLHKLYKTLTQSLQQFEIKRVNLEQHPQSRHTQIELLAEVKTLEDQWTFAINDTRAHFANDWDTRNLLLNFAAAATGLGLLLLLVKNVWLKAEGENFELFQFDHAHSRQIDDLYEMHNQAITALRGFSHFNTTQKTEEQTKRCFTRDMVTTNKTLTELSFMCNRLRTQIDLRVDASTSSKLRPSTINFLNDLHADLVMALQVCHQRINALQKNGSDPASDDFQNEKMQAERDLMGKWCQAIQTIPTDHKKTLSFGLDLTNALFSFYPMAQQFEIELQTYADTKKPTPN